MEILPNRAPPPTNHMSVKLEPEIVLLAESDSDDQDDFTPEKIEVVPELVALGDDDDDYDDEIAYNTSVVNVVNYGGGPNSKWQNMTGNHSFYTEEQDDGNDSITYDQLKLQHEIEGSRQFAENDEDEDDDYDEDVILIDSDDDDMGDNQSEDKPFSCPLCQKKVSTSYNLKRHMMIHTGEKPYGCDLCDKRFREFSDLKKHRRKHTSEAHFKCMVCNNNSPSPFDPTKCTKCLYASGFRMPKSGGGGNGGGIGRVSSGGNYQQPNHRIVKIRNPDIPRLEGNKRAYICTFCDRIFGSSSNLKRHIMIHTGEKPYTCNVCNRPFRELSTLRKHQATHTAELSGDGGNSSFTNLYSDQVKQSEFLMGKDIETICTYCFKFFKSKEHLRSHMLTHD